MGYETVNISTLSCTFLARPSYCKLFSLDCLSSLHTNYLIALSCRESYVELEEAWKSMWIGKIDYWALKVSSNYYFRSSEASALFLDLDFDVPLTPFAFLFGESNNASLASS